MIRGPLCFPSQYEDISRFAVGITWHGRNLHAVAIFRASDGQLKLLEMGPGGLASQDMEQLRDHTSLHAWAVPHFDDIVLMNIAAYCEAVCLAWPTLEYGFRFAIPEVGMIPTDGCVGFTCSSLVLGLLHGAAAILINYSTWQQRADDGAFHASVYRYLVKERDNIHISQSTLDANQQDVNCLRYRPQEVVAASMLSNPPNDFDPVASLGVCVDLMVRHLKDVAGKRK